MNTYYLCYSQFFFYVSISPTAVEVSNNFRHNYCVHNDILCEVER